jgi:hypothetical protein
MNGDYLTPAQTAAWFFNQALRTEEQLESDHARIGLSDRAIAIRLGNLDFYLGRAAAIELAAADIAQTQQPWARQEAGYYLEMALGADDAIRDHRHEMDAEQLAAATSQLNHYLAKAAALETSA